jgi:hypothetical protein
VSADETVRISHRWKRGGMMCSGRGCCGRLDPCAGRGPVIFPRTFATG